MERSARQPGRRQLRVTISRRTRAPEASAAALRQAVQATLRRHGVQQAEVSVVVVDDGEMAQINEQYLGHHGPTDVITFDLRGDGAQDWPEGEVVVSVETARREAAARGHDTAAELMLYAVHGTLHLLGSDDRTRAAARRMHAMEDEILQDLGVGAVYGAKAS